MPKENVLFKGNISGRFAWVDCCKAMAIIAVLVDHTNGILYTNQYVGRASYYSVGLFVLFSG